MDEPYRCERCGAAIHGGVNAWGDDDALCVDCAESEPPGPTFAAAVAAERRSQDAKWGVQRHPWAAWAIVLGEEYGEVCEAINALTWHRGEPDGDDRAQLAGLRAELVQVAAVCAQMIEQLEEEAAR